MRYLFVFLLVFLFLPSNIFALSTEVSINKDGRAIINGIKVMQLAGSTLFARMYWGDAFVRITIKTDNKTIFYRATGEKTTLAEISLDDILDVEGELEPGGNQLVLLTKTIKNTSVQKKQSILKGKVITVDSSKNSFLLQDDKKNLITVISGTTTQFSKGNRIIDLLRVRAGDTISQTSGDYDLKNKSLQAKSVNIFVDLNLFKPQIHEGVITSIRGIILPTDMSIKIGGVNYIVYLTNNSSVINKDRKNTSLSRFEVGDKVRLYGTIRETDDAIIDAEVIRNMDI